MVKRYGLRSNGGSRKTGGWRYHRQLLSETMAKAPRARAKPRRGERPAAPETPIGAEPSPPVGVEFFWGNVLGVANPKLEEGAEAAASAAPETPTEVPLSSSGVVKEPEGNVVGDVTPTMKEGGEAVSAAALDTPPEAPFSPPEEEVLLELPGDKEMQVESETNDEVDENDRPGPPWAFVGCGRKEPEKLYRSPGSNLTLEEMQLSFNGYLAAEIRGINATHYSNPENGEAIFQIGVVPASQQKLGFKPTLEIHHNGWGPVVSLHLYPLHVTHPIL